MKPNSLPQIAIVGRANVGKSTLFNKLIEKNKAIVSPISGTTRDRNIDIARWRDREFILVDTGGLDVDRRHGDLIETGIARQAQKAIKDANLILFLINVKDGVLPVDKDLAREIVKSKLKNKTILVANKADSPKWRQVNNELFKLNLGEPVFVSAASGSGLGDLLDIIADRLPLTADRKSGEAAAKKSMSSERSSVIRVAIIGRPNVGKSSLLNSILGEERVIVTDIPHTTREAHDIEFFYQNQRFVLIDTAGMTKRGKIDPKGLERKSIDKSLGAIKEADVVLFITEVQKRIETQDKKITQEILENSKPLVIVANKWDLIPDKDTATVNKYVAYYKAQFPYLWWAPIIFVSAKENLRAKKILELIGEVKKAGQTEISDSQLEKFLKSKIKQHRPSRGRGLKNPYIYKIEQTGTNPPRFAIFVNDPAILHFSYIRFLQNSLREKFGLLGVPIQIETKKQEIKKTRNQNE